jgi:uncharacterized delta-60 repeat protein
VALIAAGWLTLIGPSGVDHSSRLRNFRSESILGAQCGVPDAVSHPASQERTPIDMPPKHRKLGTCRFLVIALAGLGGLAGPAGAATPAFQEAPGRVVFAVDAAAQNQSTATSAVALPNGGVVIGGSGTPGPQTLVTDPHDTSYAAQLEPDGQLDPLFGHGGIAKIPGIHPGPNEIIRQPDGKLLMVGTNAQASATLTRIARLNPDGSPDTSFGTGGVETLGIAEPGAVGIQDGTVALLPSGEIVATGTASTSTAVTAHDPIPALSESWDVVELTSTGALDPAFGSGGVLTLSSAGSGQSIAVAPGGDILVTGYDAAGEQLTRLTPSGGLDPSFNGGQPVTVPGADDRGLLVVNPDGSVLTAIANLPDQGVVRYTPTGALDPTFGAGGLLALPSNSELETNSFQLLPLADGDLLEIDTRTGALSGVAIKRLTANGVVDPTLGGPSGLQLNLGFGGADQLPFVGTVHPQSIVGLAEDSFSGSLLQRPDGSLIAVGGVSVFEPTPSQGTGTTISRFAAEALTTSFQADPSFGGPATPPRVRLRLPAQSTASDIHAHNIQVTLTASEPGDALIVVKAAGRTVAQSLLPVLRVGPNTLPVILTTSGLKWLRTHPRSRVTMTTEARDLLTNIARATATGRLH